MATIRQIETALANANRAGDKDAVVRLTQILDRAKAQGAPQGEMGWGEVASRALSNIPASAGKFASDIGQAVLNPFDTLQAVGDVGAGALREGARAVLPTPVFSALDSLGGQEAAQRASDSAIGVGQFYKDRYGSMEGFKRAIAEDPVGVAADLSLPVTGAGGVAVRAPGVVGRVGRVIQTVGRNMDPVTAAGNVARGGGRAVSAIGGWASGVGDVPLIEAFNARRAGGAREQALLSAMRDPAAPITDVVDEARANLEAFDRTVSNEYRSDIQSTRNSTAQVDWTPIRNAVNDVVVSMTTRGGRFYGGENARRTINRIINLIHDYRTNPSLQTPEALDALKQEISDMQITMGPGVTRSAGQGNRAATSVADAIRQEIIRLDPSYETTMRRYAQGKEISEEIQKSLGLSDKTTKDAALRKLQSTTRNNVQTNYGARNQLLDQIDPRGTLRATLSGQALNTWAPRGIARAGGAMAIPAVLASVGANPAMWVGAAAAAPFAMPRAVGEVAGLLGAGARRVDQVAAANPNAAAVARNATRREARYAAQEAGGIANETEAFMEDAKGNVYDRKGRMIRRGTK